MADVETPQPLEKWQLKRQLWVTVALLAAITGLLLDDKIKEATWADITVWVFGLYMLGEAGASLATAYKR
jgi:hypothetical protein